MLEIRAMTIDDYDEVLRFWIEAKDLDVSPAFDTRNRTAAYLARNPGLSTVALDDGRVVGTVLCGHDGRRGSLYNVAVAEDHRRRGIARKMLDRSMAGLKEAGLTSAFLMVYAANLEAAAFWEHNGFAPVSGVNYHFSYFGPVGPASS